MAVLHGKNYGKPSLDLNFAGNKSLIDTTTGTNYVTFSRAQSGNEATYVGSDGLIKYAAADEARFDHDPSTGECLGLLIEESRTNSEQYSQGFTSGWSLGYAQTTTGQSDPMGGTDAILVKQTNGTSTRQFISSVTGLNFGSNSFTVSVFVKYVNYDYVIFTGTDQDNSSAGNRIGYLLPKLRFQFSTETISFQESTWPGSTQTLDYGFEKYPNGWYRLWMTRNISVRTNRWGISVQSNYAVGINDLDFVTGDNSSSVLAFGFQIEAGSFPTSYILTAGSTVTRAADVCTITGDNFSSWFNQSAGTFVGTVGSRGRLLLSSVSTGPNVYEDTTYSFFSNSEDYGGSFNLRYEDRSQVILNYMNAGWTSSIPMQNYAGAYSAEGVAGAWEGNLGTPQTPLSKPLQDDLSHMWIGRIHSFSDSKVQHISRLTYYPKRLPDIELQQLTK